MDYQLFLNWLNSERNMSSRSARDVVSRLKRVINMIGSNSFDKNSIVILNDVEAFDSCSMYIKSQLRRSVTLYLEHIAQK